MRPTLPDAFLTIPITHRALHDVTKGRAENSPAAIRAAIDAGYGIEIDLQLSADGQAMVFHDETLDRLTGESGLVNQRRAADLSRIPLTGSTDTIPTLTEVLALVAGRVPLLIEIKDQTGDMSPTDARLEEATATALAGYNGPVAVMSFNPHAVINMARLAPNIPRGITTSAYDPADWHPVSAARCAELRQIPDYDRAGACFISHEASDLARPRVAELKTKGAVLCWTITSPEAEAKARKIAQNITFERYLAAIPA